MKTNIESGPKFVQSGLKTVQRKRDPGPKLVQTGPKRVQAQIHIFENHLLSLCWRQMRARMFLKQSELGVPHSKSKLNGLNQGSLKRLGQSG